jgi:histo-blood group ABO system transferase
MMRLSMYDMHSDLLSQMDYLFATDADMLFVDTVGDEILSDRVATQHPGFVGKRGTYETNRISTAYVGPQEGQYYFAGGFNGGSSKEFLKMVHTITENIKKDLEKGFIAVWHDESHINRYFINNPPTLILSPSYCYPESWNLNYHRRLLALDKNHSAMRK